MKRWEFQGLLPLVLLPLLAGAPARAQPGEQGWDWAAVPLAGGDTDMGLGAGVMGSVARPDPELEPESYRLRLELGAFATVRRDGDAVALPFVDVYLKLTVPHLLGGRLRLETRAAYTSEANLRYFGLGNAAPRPADDVRARDLHERTHPNLWARGRYRLPSKLFIELGAAYTENRFDVGPDTLLARDLREGDPEVQAALRGTSAHGVALGELSFGLDTRDDDVDPKRGQYHQVTGRVSPRLGVHVPFAYQQANATLRFFLPLVGDRLTAAVWSSFDALAGAPPYYELARFEDTSALGGPRGVRGVPGQRYYGKLKALGSLELRARLLELALGRKPWGLGLAAFADGGRVWSDASPRRELDGAGLGLKYGLGGGLRLHQGRAFVARLDVAWSPDARPIGVYFVAGHAH
jgi:outer membrane protein assembly factor BamA